MGTYTANYQLYMPTVGEQGWGELINGNYQTIDTTMKSLSNRLTTCESKDTSFETRIATLETGEFETVNCTGTFNAENVTATNVYGNICGKRIGEVTTVAPNAWYSSKSYSSNVSTRIDKGTGGTFTVSFNTLTVFAENLDYWDDVIVDNLFITYTITAKSPSASYPITGITVDFTNNTTQEVITFSKTGLSIGGTATFTIDAYLNSTIKGTFTGTGVYDGVTASTYRSLSVSSAPLYIKAKGT